MQDIEIYVNNQRIELIGSEVIGLTLVGNDVAKLEKVNVNLSNGFSIPRTAVNELIFELSSEINSTSLLPYQKIPCFVKQNGIEIEGYTNATMVINEIKEKTYEVTLYGNEFDLLTALGDLKIWELPLTEYSHIKNTANVVIGVNAGLSNGWLYPVIDWGYDETNVMSNGNKNVATQNMYPAIYVKPILDKIFAQVGKTYTLPTNINTSVEKQIVTVKSQANPNPITEINNDIQGLRNIDETIGTITDGTQYPIDYTDIENIAAFEGIYKKVRVKFKAKIDLTLNEYPAAVDVNGTLNLLSGLYEFLGDPTQFQDLFESFQFEWRAGTLEPQTQTFEMTAEFDYTTNALFRNWVLNADLSIYNIFETKLLLRYLQLENLTSGYTVNYKVYETLVTYDYIDFPLSEGLNENDTIHFVQWLPDLTCKDFIKAVMQVHGLNIKYDTFNDNFVFSEMNKIYENLGNGIYYDWSNKLISQIPTKHQFDLGYAQNNYVKWKDDKTDEIYDMSVFDLNLQMANENVELQKDLIKMPFAACRTVTRIASDIVPKVRMVKTEGLEKPESRYLSNVGYASGAPAIIIGGTGANNFKYFRTPLISNDAFSGYNFFDGETGGGENYGILNNSPRKILALFNLDVLDIYSFDFDKPIYIKTLQAFFYANRINNFIAGKPTEVELIKL